MSDALYTALGGGVIGAVAAIVGPWLVSRTNARSARTAATLPPYDALANRVSTLETEAEKAAERRAQKDADNAKSLQLLKDKLLEYAEDRDQLVAYITEWFRWYHAGRMPPPPPVPMHLRDQLVWEDPDPIEGEIEED